LQDSFDVLRDSFDVQGNTVTNPVQKLDGTFAFEETDGRHAAGKNVPQGDNDATPI
jgi:hypothetical protein